MYHPIYPDRAPSSDEPDTTEHSTELSMATKTIDLEKMSSDLRCAQLDLYYADAVKQAALLANLEHLRDAFAERGMPPQKRLWNACYVQAGGDPKRFI